MSNNWTPHTMPSPQYRFSYHTFSRYAPCIGSALRAWPNAVVVEAPTGNVDSYAQPLRDALTAKIERGYKHPTIPEDLWPDRGPRLKVSPRLDGIWVGPSEALVNNRKGASFNVATISQTLEYIITNHNRALDYVMLLVQTRGIQPLPTFIIQNPTPERLEELAATYPDVAVVEVEGAVGKYQII